MQARLILAALSLTLAAAPVDAQSNNRNRSQTNRMLFAEMDTNNDGRVTRAEWRGSAQSFRANDWNNDGVLSGEEVWIDTQPAGTAGTFNDWTTRGFSSMDRNRDQLLTHAEWQFDNPSFRRADHNRDGIVSRSEFLSEGAVAGATDSNSAFAALDKNGDQRISRGEWLQSRQSFDNLDANRDGYLSRAEARQLSTVQNEFSAMDVNRDGTIRLEEWRGSRQTWDERDANRDGRLTQEEFYRSTSNVDTRSAAYRAGFERGKTEGLQAGREDRHSPWGFDVEGQRELDQADSGWEPRLGPRPEYQSGYRAGFRQAYPEGYKQGQ